MPSQRTEQGGGNTAQNIVKARDGQASADSGQGQTVPSQRTAKRKQRRCKAGPIQRRGWSVASQHNACKNRAKARQMNPAHSRVKARQGQAGAAHCQANAEPAPTRAKARQCEASAEPGPRPDRVQPAQCRVNTRQLPIQRRAGANARLCQASAE